MKKQLRYVIMSRVLNKGWKVLFVNLEAMEVHTLMSQLYQDRVKNGNDITYLAITQDKIPTIPRPIRIEGANVRNRLVMRRVLHRRNH